MFVEHNISRVEYLLKLYRITLEDLLFKISNGLARPIKKGDLYGNEIKLSHLKKIDKIFNKGLEFYLNPRDIIENRETSIFFRKDVFNSDLNIEAKKIVTKFEDLKHSLSAISKLSDIHFDRTIPIYTVNDSPKKVADEVREFLYPNNDNFALRDFLKSLIAKFSEHNILVFEFIETWNKKEVANINGFYISPNVIVLKRQQKSLRREIFTLAHELGHYLLNEEEIEQVEVKALSKMHINKIEKWCNDFSFFFLVGKYSEVLSKLNKATEENDYYYELIQKISKMTNLSVLAIYTRLLYSNKISPKNYAKVKNEIDERYKLKLEEEQKKKELDKLSGIKRGGAVPKAINSPLFVNTLQIALQDGVINEYDFCKKLNIKPEKIDRYI